MTSSLKRLLDKRTTQETDGGFTLIELLIVIVVLGILAAVVVFSLGSVTSKSAVSACQADGATINTGMAAYNANVGSYPLSIAALTTSANGGPYLQSWPANYAHYTFLMDTTGGLWVAASTGTASLTAPGAGDNAAFTASTSPKWYPWAGNGSQACVLANVK